MESVQKSQKGTVESALDLGVTIAYPFALRAACLLNVPKIIQAAGPGAELSASQICAHFPNPEQTSAPNLERVLEILSCYGTLKRSTVHGTDSATTVKKYALTSLVQNLTRDDSVSALLWMSAPEIIQMWTNIHQTVLNPDEVVFQTTYGKKFYQYLNEDVPEVAQMQAKMLDGITAVQVEPLLQLCDDSFRSLTGTVVDVGGSQGTLAAAIASKYPNIQRVINFDLPDLVRRAPAIKGVEHVGGSFLDSVPRGDLVIVKLVLLNWSDIETVNILRNCCNALPPKGKAIIAEVVKPESESEENSEILHSEFLDLINCLVQRGTTRTFKQHRSLAEAAGFTHIRLLENEFMTVIEAEKA